MASGTLIAPVDTLIAPADTLIAPAEESLVSGHPDEGREYRCPECGHALRVFGVGRHRVYFEFGDARLDDPVMNRVCPRCGHGLPGKNRP
jgi:ribosomal protein S27AE